MIKDDIFQVIGCLPLSLYQKPDKEQKGSIKEKCPECKNFMWTSTLKRLKRDNHNYKLICWLCLFSNIKKLGINLDDIELVDMLKFH